MKDQPQFRINKQGQITRIHNAFTEPIWRISKKDLLGSHLINLLGDKIAANYFKNMMDHLVSKKIPQLMFFSSFLSQKTDNSFYSFTILPSDSDNAEFDCFIRTIDNYAKDFFDKHCIEQIADNIEAVLWIASPNREVLYISPFFEQFYELTLDDFLKNPSTFLSRIHPKDRQLVIQRLSIPDKNTVHKIGDDDSKKIHFRYLLHNGKWRYIDSFRFPIYDQNGTMIRMVGLAIDNSNFYKAQESIIKKQAELQQVNIKLKKAQVILEEFIAFTCHDLSQPLRAINGYITILENNYAQTFDENGRKLIDAIRQILTNMNVLVENIGKASLLERRPETKSFLNMNNILVRDIEPLFNSATKSTCRIDKTHLSSLYANKEHIISLFQNLIDNSIKYTKEFPHIRIRSKVFKGSIVFSIQDNGIGIPKEKQQDVFKFGLRLHNILDQSGTGLGLSECKKIMEGYGGKIWVHSEGNQGSTFYLLFPKN